MKAIYRNQPLHQDARFWPYYPPAEVSPIKRIAEHGGKSRYIGGGEAAFARVVAFVEE